MSDNVEYSEHEKLAKVSDKSQMIGEFLVWCEEQGWQLATYADDSVCMTPIRFAGGPRNEQEILAQYFGIDLGKLEGEKEQMLEGIRSQS